MPSATKLNLLEAIRTALRGVAHSGYGPADAIEDIYEAYVWTRVIEAARRLGWHVTYSAPDGSWSGTLMLRRGPGVIYSPTPFTFAVLTKPLTDPLEVHLGVMVTGRSGVAHECDVLVLPADAAQAARDAGEHPSYRNVVLQAECKFYTGSLPLGLARGLRGLSADCSLGKAGGLVTNALRSTSIGRLILHNRLYYNPRLTPGYRMEVRKLDRRLEHRLRRWS
ncbi:hypothetical protein [Brevundimonas sp.]|uniref:hypothetical protein n=1 Tax=Brevundimonas sp. TaxID=1871086 RepID=UPI003D6D1385